MILLDTNVLSELMKKTPEERVIHWLDRQPRVSIWTTSITILEIRFGLRIMPSGKRRELLLNALETMLTSMIERRVAVFDTAAAEHAADLLATRQKAGRSGELRDTMIAGIAMASHASVATGNTRYFEGLRVPVINPWKD